MLLTLLTWIYITIVCLTWGALSVRLIAGKQSLQSLYTMHWPVICLTGLATVSTLTFWLSVFMPIGLAAHLIILIPVILYHFSRKRIKDLYQSLLSPGKAKSWLYYFLLSGALLLVLIITSYKIIHPDTLMYQTPAIRWMESYKAIPGIVHFDTRIAYQSWWFSVMALFRFSFIGANNFLFINSCILFWFLVFVIRRIDNAWGQVRQRLPSATYILGGWLGLLIFCFLSWEQVRLTAVSTSPDFIAALFTWSAFYLFYQYQSGKDNKLLPLLITLMSCAAMSCKFSVIVVLLLPACLLAGILLKRDYKTSFVLFVTGILIIAPCIIHNIINTGYPLYPSAALNVFHTDWKASPAIVQREMNYISAYARFPVKGYKEAEEVLQLPFLQWVPAWWKQLTIADKTILLLLLVLLIGNIATLKKHLSRRNYNSLVILLISLAGSIIWFFKAPAPRFGIGFLIPLFFSLSTGIYYSIGLRLNEIKSYWHKSALVVTGLCMTGYILYRGIHFFEFRQIVVPLGIEKPVYREVLYQGVPFYLNSSRNGCGSCPPPCTGQYPPRAALRGTDIRDGFKEK